MFIRRFIVVICYYLVIIHCHSWSTEQQAAIAYIDERIAQAEGVLGDFYKNVDLVGDSVSIDKFKEILQKIAENEIGRKLLQIINDGINKHKGTKLKLEIDNDHPAFVLGSNGLSDKIKFSTKEIKTLVIPMHKNEDEYIQTVEEDSPPDVVLFHELLHWARKVDRGITNWIEMRKEDKSKSTVITNGIFDDYPGSNKWIKHIDDKFYQIMTEERKLYIKQSDVKYNKTKSYFTKEIQTPTEILAAEQAKPWIDHDYKKTSLEDAIVTNKCSGYLYIDILRYATRYQIPIIEIEEIRTIVGAGETSVNKVDKISENSYRRAYNKFYDVCKIAGIKNGDIAQLKLRYGHNKKHCIITPEIVDWYSFRSIVE